VLLGAVALADGSFASAVAGASGLTRSGFDAGGSDWVSVAFPTAGGSAATRPYTWDEADWSRRSRVIPASRLVPVRRISWISPNTVGLSAATGDIRFSPSM